MNRLWVFGDNSSCIFSRTKERRFAYYKQCRNDIFPASWSELLSNKLNLKLNNLAVSGQSNYDIFEWFCKYSNSLKENDIVLIGWSYVQRFRLFDEYTNEYITIRPNSLIYSNVPTLLNGISLSSIDEILKNRINDKWISEINNWEVLIKAFCELKKCKLYFWTFDETLNKPEYLSGVDKNFREYLIKNGAEDITIETNGKLIDEHFGEKGQLVQSEYFFNCINNKNDE